jgi:DNA repair exonuclease SbcCD ATPase subunit
MRIKRIKIENIGRHAKLDFDCDAPVVGIIGPNGSGKSTVLEAISIGLTGEGIPNATGERRDTLESYVAHGSNKGAIELDFSTEQDGYIKRTIGKTNKRFLKWDGQEIERAKEVDELMSSILKTDKASVRSAVFIKQGALQNILFGNQSEKEDMFVELVSLSYCSQRIGIIDGKIKKLQSLVTDLTPQKEALQSQEITAQTDIEVKSLELTEYPDYAKTIEKCRTRLNLATDLEHLETILSQRTLEFHRLETELQKFQSLTEVTRNCDLLSTSYLKWNAKMQDLQKGIASLQQRKGLETQIAGLKENVEKLEAELKNIDIEGLTKINSDYSDTIQRCEKLGTLLDDQAGRRITRGVLVESLRTTKSRPPTKTADDILNMEDVLDKSRIEILNLKSWLTYRKKISKCVDKRSGMCPECGLRVENLEDTDPVKIQELEKCIKEKEAKYVEDKQGCEFAENALCNFERVCRQLEERIKTVETELDSLNISIDSYKDVANVNRDSITAVKKALQEQIMNARANMALHINQKASLEQLQRQLAPYLDTSYTTSKYNDDALSAAKLLADKTYVSLQSELTKKNTVTRLNAEYQGIAAQKAELEKSRQEISDKINSTELDIVIDGNSWDDRASLALEELRLHQETRQQKVGALEQAEKTLAGIKDSLAALMERIEKDEKIIACIQQLQVLRTILSELPPQYAKYKFEQIAEVTQQHLSDLTSQFAVSLDPDKPLNFQFTRCDGDQYFNLNQSKLSGGQRTRLSLAFLLAVQDVLIPEVGLLVLDEPTDGLDAEGIESVVMFLTELNQKMENSNTQVFVVDHRIELMTCFRKRLVLKNTE